MKHPLIRWYDQKSHYVPIWKAMQDFTYRRNSDTPDEIWLVEHYPVYTLGQRADWGDIIEALPIPVVASDRGGKITYHGPGQLVIYPLIDLKRIQGHLRMLVDALEHALIKLLSDYRILAYADPKAPGVYIQGSKVASLGLRLYKGCSYHGMAINIDMDLRPFQAIYPCGLRTMQVTQLKDWTDETRFSILGNQFISYFCQQLFSGLRD